MAGNGTAALLPDAVRSVVDWVDYCILIDTSVDRDDTAHVDAFREAAGAKFKWVCTPWIDDFGSMRNSALALAESITGNGWGVWLDSDERIVGGSAFRDILPKLATNVCLVNAWHVSGDYAKERAVRFPLGVSYVGPTHEYAEPDAGQGIIQTREVAFDELPRDKDSPAWKAKLGRDIRILTDYTNANPDDPNLARWYYYLGDAYAFSDLQRAVICWHKAVRAPGWTEIKGWAALRLANAHLETDNPEKALEEALHGLSLYPHGPELFWVAAAACVELKRYEDAIAWAMHSAICGSFAGWGKTVNRSAYVWPPAHWESPYDLLAHCYAKIGKKSLAKEADRKWREAKAAREAA